REKAEAEAEAQAQAQAQAQAKAQAEIEAIQAQEKQSIVESAVEKTQESTTSTNEPVFEFLVKIPFTGTINEAVAFAREIKAKYGDQVQLTKIK
ncbi:hypothetical protein ABWH66_11430, partial [Pasteurella multocida]